LRHADAHASAERAAAGTFEGMARLTAAPKISFYDAGLLEAAGRYRQALAAVLWPEFPGVVARVTDSPRYFARIPANWVPHVLPCLSLDTAKEVAAADSRRCTQDAYSRYRAQENELARTATSERPVQRDAIVGLLSDLASAATPFPTESVAKLVEALPSTPRDDLEIAELLAALWRRADWADAAQRLEVAGRVPAYVVTKLLEETPVWSKAERTMFVRLEQGGFGRAGTDPTQPHWQAITAGPPTLDVTELDALEAEMRELPAMADSFSWTLLLTAAGHAPDFAMLSRRKWGEHTAAAVVWAAKASPDIRARVADAHCQFLDTYPLHRVPPERPHNPAMLLWALEELAGDSELRVSLAMHCRTAESLTGWLDMASPAEVDAWRVRVRDVQPFTLGDLVNFLSADVQFPVETVLALVRSRPGVLTSLRSMSISPLTKMVLAHVGDELGDDPMLWRTAFEISSPDTTIDDVVAAARAIHSTESLPAA
jgi:hypothetical protein